ncbi:MAG: hypothetical protein JF588_00890 [Caulobacterales bacterium]|nr:hypothetical protein [Caulobacterales bacterium]
MTLSSYSDVFAISHDREHHEDIHAGDIVATGQNLYPQYEVVAVNGEKAWVRNVHSGVDGLALLSRCRKVAPEAFRHAAE